MVNDCMSYLPIYSRMQPLYCPAIIDLLGCRIDMIFDCDVKGKSVMRWCQGEVTEVMEERTKPTGKVLWDKMPDVLGCKEETESYAVLMPSKWNPRNDCNGTWRLDVEVECGDIEEHDDVDSVVSKSEESLWDYGTDSDVDTLKNKKLYLISMHG